MSASSPNPNLNPDNIDYAPTSNVARLHAAVAREKNVPVAKATPITMGIIAGIAGLALVAGAYFASNIGSIGSWGVANVIGYRYVPEPPEGASAAAGPTEEKLHEPDLWIAQGQSQYALCAACHQTTGEGVPGQYPPLKGSEFVIHGEKRLVAILKHGIVGSLTVNGKAFNGTMEPLGSTKLNDKQLAQVLSYIRNSWGNKASVIYEDQVKALAKELGNRPAYSEAELRAIPEGDNAPPSEWPEKLKKAAGGAAAPAAPPAGAPAAGTPAPTPTPAPK
ncbi:MAG TPA: cytochrome c [Verrucomicrobiales bacterium]|jgi:mono/diheme cytochrome c family protein|nr:cytochrome c [Verrucomicrobiales bacterium]